MPTLKTSPTLLVAFAGILLIGMLVAALVIIQAQLVSGGPAPAPTAVSTSEPAEVWTNSIGMRFARIEPSTFTMGSDRGDWDEKPVRDVTISQPFYIQKAEVTADQYRQFDADFSGSRYAMGVSWYDALAFCEWLSQKEGRTYRLPTEAEWEYVAKNASGVELVLGGPLEWVQDWYGMYPHDDQIDPVGPEQGIVRVVRGGGLDEDSSSSHLRSANRAGMAPGFRGDHIIGFRVVMAPMPTTTPWPYVAPFVQQGVKQTAQYVSQGPDPHVPYFRQRPVLPIPPENSEESAILAVGLPPVFKGHNHSPALEVCSNGDVLAVYYTALDPTGKGEYGPDVALIATRLRFGSESWDMPSLLIDFPDANDHAPLLWNDGDTLHLFWGSPRLRRGGFPFQWISSEDCGATWSEAKFPTFTGPIGEHSRQPINSAFRGPDGTMYVASDGEGGESVLWASSDNGETWFDTGGRSGGRHTTCVLLNDGRILGMGGKNTDIDGYMPKSISSDFGKSWRISKTPFSTLGSNQRPTIIRLASGRLFFASDFQRTKDCYQPAGITEKGALVALSEDEGQTWHIKRLPGALRHESRECDGATLGYAVARQAPNGVIHLITSMNWAAQHFELNEAWVLSDAVNVPPPDPCETGTVKEYHESYSGGELKMTWSAKMCYDGRYLLHGAETWYHENGQKQYEVTYENGRKIGAETYWTPDGVKLWSWEHDETSDTSVWTQWWPNGIKRIESTWRYGGRVAHGRANHWDSSGAGKAAWDFSDGELTGPAPLPAAQN
jgi:hypothetical protein